MATHCCRVHKAKQWSWLVPLLFDEGGKEFSGGNSQIILEALKLSHLASSGLGAFQHNVNSLSTYNHPGLCYGNCSHIHWIHVGSLLEFSQKNCSRGIKPPLQRYAIAYQHFERMFPLSKTSGDCKSSCFKMLSYMIPGSFH